ncbi:MAG: TIGR04282 family arsenosugar biosynthesis glycosyltransferase [Deltaproteobacteria bacterium]|nr:TIGR04282 family arsenosugar biosynthesis glycosyltransferase [Deltaproteobacteria bacterium]
MFVKYPEKGKVKSRLSQYLDEDMIVRLYRAFIEDLLARLSEGDYGFWIAYHPAERKKDFPNEFGNTFSYLPQAGTDLGEKMHNAFRECFPGGFRWVVIIGSDSPDLPPQIIEEAFQALEKGGAVIGPACDGGYYLIGFGRESFTPDAFTGIAWGTDSVCKTTMDILESLGIRVHVLPVWRDIDLPEDVVALINDSEKTGFSGSKTIACLRDYGFTKGC